MNYKKILPKEPGNILPYKQYSVAIILHEIQGKEYILLEKRSPLLAYQPSEISLPGGKIEAGETKEEAAVRESCEELLLRTQELEVYGQLDSLHTPYGIEVSVFFMRLHRQERISKWNDAEVQEVFYFPLEKLLKKVPTYFVETAHIFDEDFPFEYIQGGKDYPFKTMKLPYYFYPVEDTWIWGLTARILHYFGEKIKEIS
ncbi:MAG: CoA pyrophosphatase [Tissierellia bacterium]|jgi:8-oxo-dGTP pyrophosphatase MutT (NUDIX family)|nr:CoA pyrophosphatase [Tissierellia bacterium]